MATMENGGYRAASVAAIAEHARVSTGALYRHFPSKAGLFVEVFRAHARRELAAMEAAAEGIDGSAERLAAVVEAYASIALKNRRLAWALVYEPVHPLVDAERVAHRQRFRDDLSELLQRGMRAGDFPQHEDPRLLAAVLVGGISEALAGPLSPIAEQTDQHHTAEAVVELALRTVGARR